MTSSRREIGATFFRELPGGVDPWTRAPLPCSGSSSTSPTTHSAITAADLDEYVGAITPVGALRAGLGVYQAYFETAEQVAPHAKTLEVPVVAYGGDTCLGELTLTSVRAVAPDAQGGVIPRCGHWAPEERPAFVADVVGELAARSASVLA